MTELFGKDKWKSFEEMNEVLAYSVDLEELAVAQRHGYKISLDPIRSLLHRNSLDSPVAPIVQIAGSKGKGGTAMMLEALLRMNGLKTGLYHSPHLLHRRERILINGEWIPESQWLDRAWDLWSDSQKAWEPLSRFELETALALSVFQEEEVDVILLEAGLGGVDDATSALPVQLQLLTSIELEHTELLGHSLTEITNAKIGGLQEGASLVCGHLKLEALQTVRKFCKERQIHLYEVEQMALLDNATFHEWGTEYSLQWKPERWRFREQQHVSLRGFGGHLPLQVSLAVFAAQFCCRELLGRNFLEESLEILSHVQPPARLQLLEGEPPLLLDCAHTPDSIRATMEAFELHFGENPCAVLAALNDDKNISEILKELAHYTEVLVVVPNPGERSWEPLTMHSEVRQLKDVNVIFLNDVLTGLQRLRTLCPPERRGLVTGSMRLAAAVLKEQFLTACEDSEPVV